MDSEVKKKIVKEFNEKYGRSLLNLEQCRKIKQEYEQKKAQLETEVCKFTSFKFIHCYNLF